MARRYQDPVTKANILNKFFHGIFSKDPIKTLPHVDILPDPNLSNLQISQDEVYKVLHYLGSNKAIGPDGIPTRILKEFDWKRANVIPIFKKGDPKPNNY